MKRISLLLLAVQVLAIFTGSETWALDSHYRSELSDSISTIVEKVLVDNGWDAGQVIVVEAGTGQVWVRTSLRRISGNHVVPLRDTFDEERTAMMVAPTYLALLESGQIEPNDTVDTGMGIYGEWRDHNWRRGGYGVLSMERALTCHSVVAMTKALERVYGKNMEEYERRMACYLNGQPDRLMGLVAFFNAVANNGRMMRLITEGNPVVENEQIASKGSIALLQRGLRRCVTDGIFKKAGCEGVDVAASGRVFALDGTRNRMELCGYFPADKPKFTVMVVVEKNGLPATAAGLCGLLMKDVVRLLLKDMISDK